MKMLKKAAICLLVLIGLKRVKEENEETISIDEAFAKGDFVGREIVIDDFRYSDENLYGVICGALNVTNLLMLKIGKYYFGNIEWAIAPGDTEPRRSQIFDTEMSLFLDPEAYRICFDKSEKSLTFFLKDWGNEDPVFGFRLTRMKRITILF